MKVPRYDSEGLAAVLPSVARSLAPRDFAGEGRRLASAQAGVVVLADGLGARLLRRRSGHAPFLREHLDAVQIVAAGFPTTTATSMGTFGTGLPPGAHGLSGYLALDPERDVVFNELTWDSGPTPRVWQPAPTVFERAEAAGLRPAMVGPSYFDGSGLTTAALRGATFFGAEAWQDRVSAALAAVAAGHRLVYCYWGEIDKAGHQFGVDSWQWGDALEEFDRGFARLATERARGTSLTLTADHGMVDVPLEARTDIARTPQLRAGVRRVGGEMRALHLYVEPGARDDVLDAWRADVGSDGVVMSREELADRGWVGALDPRVAPRFGDVVVSMTAPRAYVDSRSMTKLVMGLLGQHGAMTPAELDVPFLHLPAC